MTPKPVDAREEARKLALAWKSNRLLRAVGVPAEADFVNIATVELADLIARVRRETLLDWKLESHILAAIEKSLISQKAPDSVSGYKIMDKVRAELRRMANDTSGAAQMTDTTNKEMNNGK